MKSLKQQIQEHVINAYAVRNEISQKCTDKAIQNPNASKREAEMMEHLIYEALDYVRIKDVFSALDEAIRQIREKLDKTKVDLKNIENIPQPLPKATGIIEGRIDAYMTVLAILDDNGEKQTE